MKIQRRDGRDMRERLKIGTRSGEAMHNLPQRDHTPYDRTHRLWAMYVAGIAVARITWRGVAPLIDCSTCQRKRGSGDVSNEEGVAYPGTHSKLLEEASRKHRRGVLHDTRRNHPFVLDFCMRYQLHLLHPKDPLPHPTSIANRQSCG